MTDLITTRLRLRQWTAADLEPFAALNADPVVMELLGGCLSRAQSDAFAHGAQAGIARRGWGVWAVEARDAAEFMGCVGLAATSFQAHFTPCIELLWRLRRASWGQGFATEAARECLRFAFERLLPLSEVVAFTVPANSRSRAVMERLGMHHDRAGDFDHPRLPAGHPLCRHVLYRLKREDYLSASRTAE